jgi:succinyl-CoA synthetase alpha subunit
LAILADENTRVLVQGITGREAATFTKDMLDYGTRVVAGVTPGKHGRQVHGIPVYDTVRRAFKAHAADASVISVPPALVKGAVLEALDNGIKSGSPRQWHKAFGCGLRAGSAQGHH